jgi:hypothetical protein
MKFQAAYAQMKQGHDIALPEWGGFWRWDAEKATVLMHCKDGEIVDMRESPDMDFTLSHTFRDDWVLITEPWNTEHGKARLEG